MELREKLNDNPVLTIGIAVALVAGAIGLYLLLGNASTSRGGVYYKDTVTGDVFRAPAEKTPPITSPAGNEAVVVYMYGCGGCGEDQRFEGFYLKYEDGVDVYSTDMENWYDTRSDEYQEIRDGLDARCDDVPGELQRCKAE